MKKAVIYALFFVNIFDILLHIAINQPELLRIISNLIIIFASILIILKTKLNHKYIVSLGLISYLALNIIFVVNNGIGNLGIILILTTTILSLVNIFKSS